MRDFHQDCHQKFVALDQPAQKREVEGVAAFELPIKQGINFDIFARG